MKTDKKPKILLVLIVAAAVVFCVKFKKPAAKTLTVTDADGITYLAVVDQENNVYAGVTDSEGQLYGVKIDDDGHVVLDEDMYLIGEYDGTLPTNNTTAVAIHETNLDPGFDYGDAEVSRVTKDSQTDASAGNNDNKKKNETDNGETTSDSEKKKVDESQLLGSKYRTLFGSGTYLMVFSTDDPDMPYEITTAFKNGNMYFDTTVEDMACQILFLADKNQGYIIIPTLRMYCTLPEDMLTEMSSTMMEAEEEEGAEYTDIEVYDVVISDRKCQCETYTYDDGTGKSYYFYNDQLVRMDFVDADGTTTVYSISKITSDVPDSYFELPKGYMKINLSWLMSQMGEEE